MHMCLFGRRRIAALVLCAAACVVNPARAAVEREVSQYGITWTFAGPSRVGRFVNGDWWVVGPVRIAHVSPAPGPAGEDQRTKVKKNRFGDAAHRDDNRMRNGSMIIATASGSQGYDSRARNYSPKMSVPFPRVLKPGESLVSTISHVSVPNLSICHEIMWESEKKTSAVLKAAAVLTCLGSPPPDDAFRPAYASGTNTIHRLGDVRWDRLGRVKPVGPTPSWESVERYFQRVWLDHTHSWVDAAVVPTENQVFYGRECARLASLASLMLQLDVPAERKKKLLIGFVQRGIDLYGVTELGIRWHADGGLWSGRKWPILFAGIVLGDEQMSRLHPRHRFHEDMQTYFGKTWFGATALYQMVSHHGARRPYEERPPGEWDDMDRRSEGYRTRCNAQGWVGTALAALIMRAKREWNHDAFFAYCDRWMSRDDPYRDARGKHRRPSPEGSTYDPWVDAMWRAYRPNIPAQPGALASVMWSVKDKKWVPNANPNPDAGAEAVASRSTPDAGSKRREEREQARPVERWTPLPGAVELMDEQLRIRLADELDTGAKISVYLSSVRQSMGVNGMDPSYALSLKGRSGLNMTIEWPRLSSGDKRAIAAKLYSSGSEDDAFLVAFYALCANDLRVADEYLRSCPSREADINELFEPR